MLGMVERLTRSHVDALARNRRQTRITDDYGNVKTQQWEKHIIDFLESTVMPRLTAAEKEMLRGNVDEVMEHIDRRARGRQNEKDIETEFYDSMSPTDFEHYCARQLAEVGWIANPTKQSGDQGVDVIAEKGDLRVVLQCKLYSQPVGNGAVQEIVAGKLHEGANHACVVTNSTFTPQAQRLASTTGVLLLHYSELSGLDERL